MSRTGNIFDKTLVAIGNTHQQRGFAPEGVLRHLEQQGLIMVDPEWDGRLTLTPEGWEKYMLLTFQLEP